MESKLDVKEKSLFNFKVIVSTVAILTIAIILLISSYFQHHDNFLYALIISLFGAILGWLFAMLVTPYGATDKAGFQTFSKIIGSFITGYVLSKLDKVIEIFINTQKYQNEIIFERIILFISFFLLFWILVFNYRTYVLIDPKDLISINSEKMHQLKEWKKLLDDDVISLEDYHKEKNKLLRV
jgi:uncharacterized YccA/Bax inhibitor family protein